MSWGAHQFEGYVLQKHLGEAFTISYLAIVAGDAAPDFFAKAWVYGVTIDGVFPAPRDREMAGTIASRPLKLQDQPHAFAPRVRPFRMPWNCSRDSDRRSTMKRFLALCAILITTVKPEPEATPS